MNGTSRLFSQIGSLIAIFTGLLVIVLGVQLAHFTRNPVIYAFYGCGSAAMVLGVFGLIGRWMAVLANAILCSLMSGLFVVALIQKGGRVDAMSWLVLLVTIIATALLWIGLPNARRLGRFSV